MLQSFSKKSSITSRIAADAIGATRSMGGKQIKFGVDGRAAMLKGVNLLADAVQVGLVFPFLIIDTVSFSLEIYH